MRRISRGPFWSVCSRWCDSVCATVQLHSGACGIDTNSCTCVLQSVGHLVVAHSQCTRCFHTARISHECIFVLHARVIVLSLLLVASCITASLSIKHAPPCMPYCQVINVLPSLGLVDALLTLATAPHQNSLRQLVKRRLSCHTHIIDTSSM